MTVTLAFSMLAAVFLAADAYAHYRFDNVVGLNRAGYRGPLVHAKHTEPRIVVLGGSTAFGYGVPWHDAWPAQLERKLSGVQVVNLGYNAEGAASFRPTLADYAYLKPDLVILYEGYNDLGDEDNRGPVNPQVYRRQSPLFRLTGYYAILPLVLHEKWLSVSSGGHLDEAYRSQKVVFRPGLAAGAESGLLGMADVMTRQVTGPLTMPPIDPQRVDLIPPYLEHIAQAVWFAEAKGMRTLIVGQPFIRIDHRRQQAALERLVRTSRPMNVWYLSCGDAVDLKDMTLAYDGMHLTAEGNAKIATCVQPMAEWLAH